MASGRGRLCMEGLGLRDQGLGFKDSGLGIRV